MLSRWQSEILEIQPTHYFDIGVIDQEWAKKKKKFLARPALCKTSIPTMKNVMLMYTLYYIGWDAINFRQRHPVSNKQSVALGPNIDCWIGWISMQTLHCAAILSLKEWKIIKKNIKDYKIIKSKWLDFTHFSTNCYFFGLHWC